MAYDHDNIFAKILRGEIPCDKVYENDHALAFNDIDPQRPVHVLVVPKAAYQGMNDFAANASAEEALGLMQALGEVARLTGAAKSGYRLISNTGEHGHQEVDHLHFHLLGGAPAGPMLKRAE